MGYRLCDLQRAPRNADGKTERWTDVFLLKPVEAKNGNCPGQAAMTVDRSRSAVAIFDVAVRVDGAAQRITDRIDNYQANIGQPLQSGFRMSWLARHSS